MQFSGLKGGQPAVSCGKLEEAGKTDLLPANECDYLPDLVAGPCGYAPNEMVDLHIAPTPPTPPPLIPDGMCICYGEGCRFFE